MPNAIERALQAALAGGSCRVGQIAIRALESGYLLTHCDDQARTDLQNGRSAMVLAKFDDAGQYRPLKTAPNLSHGWKLEAATLNEVQRALDHFYPGRLGVWMAHQEDRLKITPLRETLNRQTGMYRVAAKVSDEQIQDVVGRLCRSEDGCLRAILWRRDATGALPSNLLPSGKYHPGDEHGLSLLCQETCNLVVAECRRLVKASGQVD